MGTTLQGVARGRVLLVSTAPDQKVPKRARGAPHPPRRREAQGPPAAPGRAPAPRQFPGGGGRGAGPAPAPAPVRLRWNLVRQGKIRSGTILHMTRKQGHEIDPERMPSGWPTHLHPARFWEEIGRTVGTFAVLEDTLKRAYFAITATGTYQTEGQAEKAFADWERDLERSMNESLEKLGKRLVETLKADERYSAGRVDSIAQGFKAVTEWRNAVCHGAWNDYDQNTDVVTLRYWSKKEFRQRTAWRSGRRWEWHQGGRKGARGPWQCSYYVSLHFARLGEGCQAEIARESKKGA